MYVKRLDLNVAGKESTLYAEHIILGWLQGKWKIPQVTSYHKEGHTEYLVTTQIPGYSASDRRAKDHLPQLVGLLAQGLKEIHGLPFEGCPLDCRVEAILARTQQMIDTGILCADDFPEEIRRTDPLDSLNAIRQQQPAFEDLVFTHGDYCLPNVLVDDGRLMGVIDWGYSGVGDRYRDFVAADYSIRRNLGAEWVPHFWEAYGIDHVDQEKMAFYKLVYDLI